MRVRIDARSRTPLSEQVRSQIAGEIASGRLLPGDRLPPVRELAVELALAANTVAKAYRELEAAGLVEGRGRRGTFVLAASRAAGAEARLAEAARNYAERSRRLGFDPDAALREAKRALRRRD